MVLPAVFTRTVPSPARFRVMTTGVPGAGWPPPELLAVLPHATIAMTAAAPASPATKARPARRRPPASHESPAAGSQAPWVHPILIHQPRFFRSAVSRWLIRSGQPLCSDTAVEAAEHAGAP